jgi:hypothetical protein
MAAMNEAEKAHWEESTRLRTPAPPHLIDSRRKAEGNSGSSPSTSRIAARKESTTLSKAAKAFVTCHGPTTLARYVILAPMQ